MMLPGSEALPESETDPEIVAVFVWATVGTHTNTHAEISATAWETNNFISEWRENNLVTVPEIQALSWSSVSSSRSSSHSGRG